jgi:ribosomal protein L12E/L44/L45/RPP1/RPP2
MWNSCSSCKKVSVRADSVKAEPAQISGRNLIADFKIAAIAATENAAGESAAAEKAKGETAATENAAGENAAEENAAGKRLFQA